METADAADMLREALFAGSLICAPLLLGVLISGLIASVLQAATRIQDSVLAQVPKILAVVLVLVLLLPWMLDHLGEFTSTMFSGFGTF